MKKRKAIPAAALAGALLCTAFPASAAEGDVRMCEVNLLGDADSNGTVSLTDVVKLSRYLLKTDDAVSINADLTGDGEIDTFDLALLKRMQLGKYTPEDYTKLRINEICADNKESLKDSTGASPDWIELYNPTATEIHLGGYGLSDGKKNLFKYTFPEDTVIPAGGYLVICCDDGTIEAAGELHAPFKLSAAGEKVYLTHPANGTLSIVETPPLETDLSYGVLGDSLATMTPTPGRSNESAQEVTGMPIFSKESGFYDEPFELTIKGNGKIICTDDGSDPTTSSTAWEFNSDDPKLIDNGDYGNYLADYRDISLNQYNPPNGNANYYNGWVIRAAIQAEDGTFGPVVTKSYFIGKKEDYLKNMTVVSLVTDYDNLFDEETGNYCVGSRYYEWRNSSEYQRYDAWDTRNPTNYNQSGKEWERPAVMQLFENGKLKYETGVGYRIAGNATRVNFQKSLRLYARSELGDSKLKYAFFDGLTDAYGEPITKFDKVTLRNGGNDIESCRFRDDLVHELVKDRDISVQASSEAIVYIDGVFWGYYVFKERLDDYYIQSHYGVDKKNVTIVKNGELDEGEESVRQSYEDFYNWAMSADMSDPANYQRVCDTIDIQSLMDYFTVETYICNWDFSNTKSYNNWQMWRSNTAVDGNAYGDCKWRYMLFDTEYSSGLYGSQDTQASYNMICNMLQEEEWENPASLFYHLLDNEQFCKDFEATYKEIMENNFQYSKIDALITQYVSRQEQAVRDTNKRFYGENNGGGWGGGFGGFGGDQYTSGVQAVRSFYQQRPQYALEHLQKLLQDGPSDPTSNPNNPWGPWNPFG